VAENPKNANAPRLSKEEWLAKRTLAWNREAKNLYSALMLLGEVTKAHNVLECGHAFIAYFCRDCAHETKLKLSCFLRLCPRCAVRRSLKFVHAHTHALSLITEPKLLTLTFKSVPTLTPETLTSARKSLTKLRHRKLWHSNVTGGLAGLELTWSPKGWHPHWHALLDSSYISRYPLSKAWKQITQGAWLVDIRQCDPITGCHEVAKYIAKGTTFYSHPALLRQFLDTTKGRRFFTTFGSFYKTSPGSQDPATDTNLSSPPDILNPHHHHGPQPTACEECGGIHLICTGKHIEDPIDPPKIQLPLRKDTPNETP